MDEVEVQKVMKNVSIKIAIVAFLATAIFCSGYFVSLRVSGGSAELIERYREATSNLDAARGAQREASSRTAGLSNQLERAQVSIGVLLARNGELVETVGRLQSANRIAIERQSNIAGGVGRAIDIATESGKLLDELRGIAGSLPAQGGSGN